MLFGGDHVRRPKVALGGRSAPVESKEEVLERTRLERERRRKQKQETKSAIVIQAAWRAFTSQQRAKASVREDWTRRFGATGEQATLADVVDPNGAFLRQSMYFLDPRSTHDVVTLATVCRLAVGNQIPTSNGATHTSTILPPMLGFVSPPGRSDTVARAQLWAKRLVKLAIISLSQHAASLAEELQRPYRLSPDNSTFSVSLPLAHAIISLLSLETWALMLSPEEAMRIVSSLIARLGCRVPGLFEELAVVLAVGAPFNVTSNEEPSLAEAVCGHILALYFKLQQGVDGVLGGSPSRSRPWSILFVPQLRERCPSLLPVLPYVWRASVERMAQLRASQWLQPLRGKSSRLKLVPQSEDTSVWKATLLGNLVVIAPLGLSLELKGGVPQQQLCTKFLSIASQLLSEFPSSAFPRNAFPHGSKVSDGLLVDDEDREREQIELDALATTMLVSEANNALPHRSHPVLLPFETASQILGATNETFLMAVSSAALPADSQQQASPRDANTWLSRHGAASGALVGFLLLLLRISELRHTLLMSLALHTCFVSRLWCSYLRPAHCLSSWTPLSEHNATSDPGYMLPLSLFAEVMSYAISVTGDRGLYEQGRPLPLKELYDASRPREGAISLLRSTLWHVLWVEIAPLPGGWPPAAAAVRSRLARHAGRLLGRLHDRNGRRPFAPPDALYADGLPPERFHSEIASWLVSGTGPEAPEGSRAWTLLATAPCLVPFMERAKVFQQLVKSEKSLYLNNQRYGGWGTDMFDTGRRFLQVHRGRVLGDALIALHDTKPDQLRGRIRVAFVNELGMEEAGVDGGGLFKEFLEAVVKEGFNPDAGLFRAATDGKLYPNPHVAREVPNGLKILEFLGQMLGKALWEGILVELPLAPFFLKRIRGAVCDADDLPLLDGQIARSLESFRTYKGDVAELGLTFSVTDPVAGVVEELDLMPNGRDTPVTSDNWPAFVHLLADFRLNKQLRVPVAAFVKGLEALIPQRWLSMFNDKEIQALVSGVDNRGLDLGDMQRHVKYAGGYDADHPVIKAFWEALASFTPGQQADFLRFVTSCPRPPLLGFLALEPALSIQKAGGERDEEGTDRLPTAATCVNLLKLPPYTGGTAEMREKLLYAIQSGAGFELS